MRPKAREPTLAKAANTDSQTSRGPPRPREPARTEDPEGGLFAPLPETPVLDASEHAYAGNAPVIVGHYWKSGTPAVLGPKAACVDYSAGKGGPLVAYQWSGETELTDEHFVSFG